MFKPETYIQRRKQLKEKVDGGLLIFPGNNESPINFPDNYYRFRQDSSYLYYWGLDSPGLAAAIDLDTGDEIIYGDELTIDDIIWMGPQPMLAERAKEAGVVKIRTAQNFKQDIGQAIEANRKIHFLPQYRHDNIIKLSQLLKKDSAILNETSSQEFAKAVIFQRIIKSPEEVAEQEKALDTTYDMHLYAMKHVKTGLLESEISGKMEGIALAAGGYVAYPIIFSVNGQTLHNHYHGNIMQEGDIALNDCGAAAQSHYAGDITRCIPVSGKFTEKQKEIYQIVLDTMESGIEMCKPGVSFLQTHLHCARLILDGLKSVGLVKGDLDEAVRLGAQALFMPHGLGHMLGLDVHDMEDISEEIVGYDAGVKRSSQFGLRSLRLARKLQPGFVLTVEPGIYFIPELIQRWKSENKFAEFINYEAVEQYLSFGGVRIEENILIGESQSRILGKAIPKKVDEVEAACQ